MALDPSSIYFKYETRTSGFNVYMCEVGLRKFYLYMDERKEYWQIYFTGNIEWKPRTLQASRYFLMCVDTSRDAPGFLQELRAHINVFQYDPYGIALRELIGYITTMQRNRKIDSVLSN